MNLTIFIKFCGFIEHSKANNCLSDFIRKFPEGKINFLYFAQGAILTTEKIVA